MKNSEALQFDPKGGGADFVMHKKALCAWVRVGSISVALLRTESGVQVELYPHGHEGGCCPAMWECSATNDEADAAREHRT